MQGRAVAVYGLVLALVAVGAYGFAATAQAPQPSIEDPAYTVEENGSFPVGDRSYTLTGFGTQQGDPTAIFEWTDEDARTSESWSHAGGPNGTTVTYEGNDYWVRIPQTPAPTNFTFLETPGENASFSVFTDNAGNWIVNDGGEYVDLEEFERLERVPVENGSTIQVGSGEEQRQVRVDEVTNESVTVSWVSPATSEVVVRQAARKNLNGQNVTVHVTDQQTAEIVTGQQAIEDYQAQHEDKTEFQTRMDGLLMSSVLAAVTLLVLIGLAFLPRKE